MSDINLIDLISSLFKLQLAIKMNHWSTNLYHRHKITDDLHSKVLGLIDRIVESFQGRYGKLDANKIEDLIIQVPIKNDENFKRFIQDTIDMMLKSVYPKLNKELTALMDELLETLYTSNYLLTLQ